MRDFQKWGLVRSLLISLIANSALRAQEHTAYVAPASSEAEQAMARFDLPDGFRVELVATEPLLANPVAFCIDELGRFYVAESFRINDGVPDNRWFMRWLADDLASRTVDDRIRMYRKHRAAELDSWGVESERVRLVIDSDGDGKADASTVFADGFRRIEDGIAAGVLARDGEVWFACIPHLWLLRDSSGDGRADERRSLHHGYGVHVAFFGHDLHGLTFGPDGKLYFSIGDRGMHVETPEGVVSAPDCGSVLRCNADGTELEIFATGLRNPQELAFDEFGNLFTGDNNSDSGDQARIVYVVEGGDSGWRMPYQYLERPYSRGPWNEDKLWRPTFPGQAAYIVPPVANFADGPSGLAYNPGAGLPPEYDRNFFLVDFRGGGAISGVRRFRLEPEGAGFRVASSGTFVWKVVATDVDFGYDGAMYLLDWVDGWTKTGKGRIYRLYHPEYRDQAADAARIMAGGFRNLDATALEKLLSHRDMRVRQRAQFELARRPDEGREVLVRVARDSDNLLARLHAIWGLGQLGRTDRDCLPSLLPLMRDSEAEVRAQAARTAGDLRFDGAFEPLVDLLTDASPRVRMLSAIALGRIGNPGATAALLAMLEANADADPFVRHGGVMGLAGAAERAALREAAAADRPVAVRRAALVAMRRRESPDVAMFFEGFDTADSSLVEEAARAAYDAPIPEALRPLARLLGRRDLPNAVRRRALYASYRLGEREDVAAITAVAADGRETERFRLEALDMLGSWGAPPELDGLTGFYRPIERRPDNAATEAVATHILELLASKSPALSRRAAELAEQYRIAGASETLTAMLRDARRAPEARVAALRAVAAIEPQSARSLLAEAIGDAQPLVRSEATDILAQVDPDACVRLLAKALDSVDVGERQRALATLGKVDSADADSVLSKQMDRLLADATPAEVRLDLLAAARRRGTPELSSKLNRYEARLAGEAPAVRYADTLYGGDADRGKQIVFEKTEVACLKCHKFFGRGGDVGPDLTRIATNKDRQYLLESIVDPNRAIAEGFDTSILLLADGTVKTGVVRGETETEFLLYDAEGRPFTVLKSVVEERQRGKSAMPDDLVQKLTEFELRDLIEFLASRK